MPNVPVRAEELYNGVMKEESGGRKKGRDMITKCSHSEIDQHEIEKQSFGISWRSSSCDPGLMRTHIWPFLSKVGHKAATTALRDGFCCRLQMTLDAPALAQSIPISHKVPQSTTSSNEVTKMFQKHAFFK